MAAPPEYAPLYPEPPYQFHDSDVLYVYGEGDEEMVEEFLPTPLDYVSNVIRFGIHDNKDVDGLSNYNGATVHIPAKYNGKAGGTLLNEWVTHDDPMAVGRELWGYPKKMGNISLQSEDGDGKIIGDATRRDEPVFSLTFEATGSNFDKPNFMPRYQVRHVPGIEGTSGDTKQVVKIGETASDGATGHPGHTVHSAEVGTAEVSLGEELEPLGPINVIGAEFINRSFTLDYGVDITSDGAQ